MAGVANSNTARYRNLLFGEAARTAKKGGSEQLGEIGRLVIEKGVVGATKRLRELVFQLQQNVGDPHDLIKVNKAIGEAGRIGMRESFKSSRTNSPAPYRVGDKSRLSGQMDKVLSNQRSGGGDQNGFYLIDTELWDREAAHWRRLNFGTQGAVGSRGKTRKAIKFRYDDRILTTFQTESKPQKRFRVPEFNAAGNPTAGFFNVQGQLMMGKPTGDNTAVQYVRTQTNKYAKPITPWDFLDAGLAAAAEEFPKQYEAVLGLWVNKAFSKGKGSGLSKKILKEDFHINLD